MRILLTTLNSKYVHTSLALKYLYSVAVDMELDVGLQEFTINNERDYVFGEIMRGGYDLLCIACYIWNIEKVKVLGRDLKKARPGTQILIGGPEVSYDASAFMEENPWVDYIIRGEGERPFRQFCEQMMSDNPDLTTVEGLTYRDGDQIAVTRQGALPYLDKLPFPYTYLEIEPDRIVYYESSRGCPYHCSYCMSSMDQTVRAMSMERVRRDVGYLMYKNVKQVKFIDRTFNYDRNRANEIWQFIIDKDNGVTSFHFEICGDLLDSASYRILSRARKGLFQFEIGLQTANPYALQAISRGDNVPAVLESVRRLVELENCLVHVDLIAGLPFDTYRAFEQSFNMAYEAGADQLQLGFLKMLKGTPMRESASRYGYVFRDTAPYEVISNDYMSPIDLVKLKMIEEVLELFHNRGGFEESLALLMKELQLYPFNFFERLADFYYSQGFQHAYHKKEQLYRILYNFAVRHEVRQEGISLLTQKALSQDLIRTFNPDVVKRFFSKGWEL